MHPGSFRKSGKQRTYVEAAYLYEGMTNEAHGLGRENVGNGKARMGGEQTRGTMAFAVPSSQVLFIKWQKSGVERSRARVKRRGSIRIRS